MHIEKNVYDNVLYTILNEPGKSKDHLQAKKDLREMGVRGDAWPDEHDRFQPARFTLTKPNKEIFLATLKKIKVPDGYSSNISRCIDLQARKVTGLKSHDSHVLMQQLLPLAMKNTLPLDVSLVLVELCTFFRKLCSKVFIVEELDQLQQKIILMLCHLEMIFPPSFFTVIVHLTVHLVHETKLAGPVQYRWMYPIERFLGKLKSYVRNKAWPEGSIAEGYIGDEVLYFCSRYFDDIETSFNRPHSPEFRALALGPLDHAQRFTAYNVNGFKFCTVSRDQGLLTQNSGVYGTFGTRSYASSSDGNTTRKSQICYGLLRRKKIRRKKQNFATEE
ncbi:hypothetical protein K1719_003315 [Acacia pycnantha]|nr:hypothetical protein K1719_003315 [Acacia pycnantha]